MDHRPLILLDVETTGGAAHKSGRITEIGALRIEGGRVVATYNQLINPETNISSGITRLTGISNQMVADAPKFYEIADELMIFMDNAIFVAHHVAFDYSFIKAELMRSGITYNADQICSVRLSRLMHPEQDRHGLDYVIHRLGLTVAHRHRAFDDAEVIWKFIEDEMQRNSGHLFRCINRLVTRSSDRSNAHSRNRLNMALDFESISENSGNYTRSSPAQ